MILTMERIREPPGRKVPARRAKSRSVRTVPRPLGRGLVGLGLLVLVMALLLVH